jgi:hypothetical protein
VYDYCIPSQNVYLSPRQSVPVKRATSPRAPKKAKANFEANFEVLGLAQTCKKLRAEFRPIWFVNVTVEIRLLHLQHFLKTFHHDFDEETGMTGNIIILVPENCTFTKYNLFPFLRMALISPQFKFKFECEESGEVEIWKVLNKALVTQPKEWYNYLRRPFIALYLVWFEDDEWLEEPFLWFKQDRSCAAFYRGLYDPVQMRARIGLPDGPLWDLETAIELEIDDTNSGDEV